MLVAEQREPRVVDAELAEHNAGNPSQPAELASPSKGCVRTRGIHTGERSECAMRSISEAVLGRPSVSFARSGRQERGAPEDWLGA